MALHVEKSGQLQIVRADLVVLAIPCKPYGNIEFDNSILSNERLSRIKAVAYGTHGKILVPSLAPKKNSFIQAEDLQILRRPMDPWYFLFFGGDLGSQASKKSLAELSRFAVSAAGKYAPLKIGSEIIQPTVDFEAARHSVAKFWNEDPYIGGSYSYYTPEMKDESENTVEVEGETVIPLLAPIAKRVFFAGEHTTPKQSIRGTVEAAVDSGLRASRMLFRALEPNEMLLEQQ